MNNFEIIKNVEQLAHPYFQFEKEKYICCNARRFTNK